jgi:hypothetical protein
MKRLLVSAACLGLVACGTPQQRCIGQATHNLTVVDRLIAESQANLDRGYAYAEVVTTMPEFVDCTPRATAKDPDPRPRQCLEDVAQTVTKPVAIDLKEEAAKLAGLREKRDELAKAATPVIAACQQQYPE